MTRTLAFLFLVPGLAGPAARADDGLGVGVAVVDITPPRGYRMAGYFSERLNTGTRDPLLAKAVVFRQGGEQAALVFCDLVALPRDLATRARDEAGRRSGVKPAHVAVAATHSHTGPLFAGVLRDLFHARAVAARGKDEAEAVDYPAFLVDRIAEAVAQARKAVAPARLDVGVGNETRLAFNRRFHMKDGSVRFNPGVRNPDVVRVAGPIDPEVGVVAFRHEAGGKPFAAITVFALHLDTVGGTEYSADYPYFLENELRTEFGPRFVSLFGNGTCGDINHIDVSRPEQAKTEAIGRTLGRTVLKALKATEPVRVPTLGVASEVVEAPVQTYPAEEVARARKVLAGFEANRTPFLETVRVVTLVDLADHYKATEPLEVQAFRLGPELAVVTLPGEVFVELGLAVKKGSPFRNTFVIELANGCPAYVPTKKAFAEGSYEVVNSRVAPGGGERMAEAALRALRRLKPEAPGADATRR